SQWLSAKFQADLINYQTFLAMNTNQHTLEATNAIFNFTAFPLSVSKIEQFTVTVDGHALSVTDDPVTAVSDTMTANEDSSATSGNLLANDLVPDLVSAVQVGSAAHGTVSLATNLSDPFNASATATYTPDHAFFDHLAAGVTATDTFTYTVTDADGDTGTATVTVTVVGVNDTASITGTPTGSLTEDATSTVTGTLTVSDVDDGEAHSKTVAAGTATASGLGTYSVDADGHWSYTVDETKVQLLFNGETTTESF